MNASGMPAVWLAAAIWLLAAPGALAGDIAVSGAWARATPPQAQAGAAFLTIENRGSAADALVGARAEAAGSAELHETRMVGSVMQMRPVERVPLAPGETVTLRPGGLHVMLVGLAGPLVEGRRFALSLRFERAGEIPVEVEVRAPGAMTMAR